MSFVWIIMICGAVSLMAIFGNIGLLGRHRYPIEPYKRVSESEVDRGRRKIIEYGCGGCHVIPGIPGAQGRVGPSLVNIREQMFIAGRLMNSTEEMMTWIRHPRQVSPGTAMPDLGVSEEDARSITAYLFQMSR